MKGPEQFIPALRFAWLTRFYDLFMRLAMPENRIKLKLIKHARIAGNQYILDFGCGTGTLAIMIKKSIPESVVFGVDVDRSVLAIAANKIAIENLEINLSDYDGIKLPYASNTFDKVVSTLVFHHLTREQKLQALSEISRVLKKDGELYIADFGKTTNVLLELFFFIWRFLDGLKNTRDNYKGLLPELIKETGFNHVIETKEDVTIFGTLYFYSAKKI